MAEVNSKLLEGIAYFEKMLKVMPGDRTTLEFLSVAYEQIGDAEKTRLSLIQLANTLLKEQDLEAADAIGSRLASYKEDDAQAMVRKIEQVRNPTSILGGKDSASAPAATANVSVAKAILSAVKSEAALVQLLSNRNIIDMAAAEVVQKHLAGLPEATRPFLVSALSILYKESTSMGEKAAAFVADTMNTPPIPLDIFSPSPDLLAQVPENLIRVRGAVPIGKLGSTLLIALLNPMDEPFRHEVETLAGCPCRFFLAHPAGAEEYLEKLYAEKEKVAS